MRINDTATGVENRADEYAPRRLTFAENAMLTIKVLAAGGLLFALLWGLNIWTSAR
jgi:hypothetical protein